MRLREHEGEDEDESEHGGRHRRAAGPMRPATTMRPRRYAPLGNCMYCLVAGVKLSEEHLIPRSLNGTLTLRDSVCDSCRVRTGRLEQATLATDLVVPRILLALKRRRARKKGPRRLPPVAVAAGSADPHGQGETATWVELDACDYPRRFDLSGFETAGLLAGVDRSASPPRVRLVSCRLQIGARSAAGAVHTIVRAPADPAAFAWSLAKWAYSFAVAERGVSGCDTRPLRQLLTGERHDVFNFVGGPDADPPDPSGTPAAPASLHTLSLAPRDGWLTVRLNLFASTGMSPYEVVIGALAAETSG